jgi:hypothetical protein
MKRCYIEYLNAEKGFQEDRIWFEGENAYALALAWGREHIENFNLEMIRYSLEEPSA